MILKADLMSVFARKNIWSQVLDDCIIKGRIVDALRFLWYPHVNWIRRLVGVGQVMDKTVFPQWFLRLQTDRGTMKFWKRWRIKGPSHPTQLHFFANLKRHDVLQGRLHFWTAVFEPGTVACTPRRNPKVKPSSRKLTSSGGYPCKYGLMALKSTGVGSLGTNTMAGSCAVGSPGSLSTGHFLPSFPCLLLWGKFSLWVLSLGGGPSRLRQFFKEWPLLHYGHEWFQVQPLRVQSPPLWSEKQKPAGT